MCNALLRRLLVFAPLLFAHPHLAASQENGVALVVGNSAYRFTAELKNPRNDAADIASILRTLGFRVVEGLDLDKPAMEFGYPVLRRGFGRRRQSSVLLRGPRPSGE